jgi:hypothetical protein
MLNPTNRHCATCKLSLSFLDSRCLYCPSESVPPCPQRLIKEIDRIFPCTEYERGYMGGNMRFVIPACNDRIYNYLKSLGVDVVTRKKGFGVI